jgi:ribosomal protein S18 acetylase RimI-like enzyme
MTQLITGHHSRLERYVSPSLHSWEMPRLRGEGIDERAVLDCGWGRIAFGQTFRSHEELIEVFTREEAGQRDLAVYVWEHHVLLGKAPDLLFVDPSLSYRLWLHDYRPAKGRSRAFYIRHLMLAEEVAPINEIYKACDMVPLDDPDQVLRNQATRTFSYFVAVDATSGEIVGTITGIDHELAFGDPDNGASFWCLAVHPDKRTRGVGRALVRHLAEHYLARGRQYLDLSVIHSNTAAIRLYRSLGFRKVPVYVVKRKNEINRPLYQGGVEAPPSGP